MLTPGEETKLLSQYAEIIDFYVNKVKPPVIECERYDPGQNLSIVALNEIRLAFEHIARTDSIKLRIRENKSDKSDYDFCSENYDDAKNHLKRAAYDAYDLISIFVSVEINKLFEDISPTTLERILPGSITDLRSRYKKTLININAIKIEKDIEDTEKESIKLELFRNAANDLVSIRNILFENLSIANEVEQTDKLIEEFSKTKPLGRYINSSLRPEYREAIKSGDNATIVSFREKVEDLHSKLSDLEYMERIFQEYSKKIIYTVKPDASDTIFKPYKKAVELGDLDKISTIKKLVESLEAEFEDISVEDIADKKIQRKWNWLITLIVAALFFVLGIGATIYITTCSVKSRDIPPFTTDKGTTQPAF